MRASRLAIVPRNVELDFESVPVFAKLIDGGLLEPMTDLFSCAFPPLERFFIESVQHFNENIRTPLLREQVRLFFHQEAMHAKVHQDWNETLWQTLPVRRRVQGNAADFLDLARRRTTRRFQLALTCAIEHFTAMFADSALREQEAVCRRCHPAIAQMWLWHAAEETEHKAVCFDVYREVVGTGLWPYLVRISAIVHACFLLRCFWWFVVDRSLRHSPTRTGGLGSTTFAQLVQATQVVVVAMGHAALAPILRLLQTVLSSLGP